MRQTMACVVAAAVILLFGGTVLALTADEVYDRMDAEADTLAAGSMVSTIQFDNAYRDGTTASNLFGSLSKPDRSLIFFIEPEDVRGTIFLTHEATTDGGDARLWLYLPVLGTPKELVSDEERGGSFAGSSLSYEDLTSDDQRKDYNATLIDEVDLTIGDRNRSAYVIEATAKPGADVETARTVLWVDAEFYIMLKMEGYNDLGNLDTTLEVQSLGEFEGKLTADVMVAKNVSDGSSTTITFIDRHRPDAEIPDSVFEPGNLPAFDPSVWGF
jgi:outer membrane lipoprotein-sorting protein